MGWNPRRLPLVPQGEHAGAAVGVSEVGVGDVESPVEDGDDDAAPGRGWLAWTGEICWPRVDVGHRASETRLHVPGLLQAHDLRTAPDVEDLAQLHPRGDHVAELCYDRQPGYDGARWR